MKRFGETLRHRTLSEISQSKMAIYCRVPETVRISVEARSWREGKRNERQKTEDY
jgi:hypothetical protein